MHVITASVGAYVTDKGARKFCTGCGSPVWYESTDYPEVVGIPLGVIDSGEVPTPGMHLWVRSSPSWCAIVDGLPQHPTMPEQE